MSSKPSNRRKPATEEDVTVAEEAEIQQEESEPTESQPQAAEPEAAQESTETVTEAEIEHADGEVYLISSLVGAARQMFGVNPEVVVGALHHADIHEKATTSQVRAAINTYLHLPV
jgi:hypothetical protein